MKIELKQTVAIIAAAMCLLLASSQVSYGQVLLQVAKANVALQSSDVTLETSTGNLSGTLLLPSGRPPFAVVLIVPGSGITDRDGNSVGLSGKSDSLKLLAEGLARGGIGSLRYDKRSVGKSSAARLATNLFETQFDDAAQWVGWLRKDSRFNAIGIVGHSEGALTGTIAAQRGGVSALVLLAGGGRRADEILVEQMERAVLAGKLSKSMLSPFKLAVAELRAGRTVTTRPKDIPDWLWKGLFAPRAQEYLISLIRYDPVAELTKTTKLDIRVLVVQGTTDLTGTVDHAKLLAAVIGESPVLIEGMNHELKAAPLDREANDKASEDPKRPLAAGLLDTIVPFLSKSLVLPTP